MDRRPGATLHSLAGNPARLRTAVSVTVWSGGSQVPVEHPEPEVSTFDTSAGQAYEIRS